MKVNELERFALLDGLTPEEADTIVRRCQITPFKKGDKVIATGGSADSLYLVRSGRIEIRFTAVYFNAPFELPLDIIGPGEMCGWSALIPPHSYTLSAYATEDSELLRIPRADLQECCEANPRLGYVVMKNIARIIGERYEIARQMLIGEIQRDFTRKENKALWKDA